MNSGFAKQMLHFHRRALANIARLTFALFFVYASIALANIWEKGECMALLPRAMWSENLLMSTEILPVNTPLFTYGAGGDCHNDPLADLYRLNDRLADLHVHRVSIFCIGKPIALHLLTCSESERKAFEKKLAEEMYADCNR